MQSSKETMVIEDRQVFVRGFTGLPEYLQDAIVEALSDVGLTPTLLVD